MSAVRIIIIGGVLLASGLVSRVVAQCPDDADSLAEFVADCQASDDCDNSAVTCNGEFSIELLDVDEDGDRVTYKYEVCKLTDASDLSHWVLSLGQIDCVEDGADLEDLWVGCAIDGEEADCELSDPDPTTQLAGLKFEVDQGAGCHEYEILLDESALESDCRFGVGCATAVTKAGNQSLGDSAPGYACVEGPACVCDEPGEGTEGCTPGYWKQCHHFCNWPDELWPPDGDGALTYDGVFGVDAFGPDVTLLDALRQGGGGKYALGRHSVAALLNSLSGDVAYALEDITGVVQMAYDNDDLNSAKSLLGDANENGACPLANCPDLRPCGGQGQGQGQGQAKANRGRGHGRARGRDGHPHGGPPGQLRRHQDDRMNDDAEETEDLADEDADTDVEADFDIGADPSDDADEAGEDQDLDVDESDEQREAPVESEDDAADETSGDDDETEEDESGDDGAEDDTAEED